MEQTDALQEKHPGEKGLKITLISIFTNAALAIVKGATGYFGNSYALIADAIESASDVFSSIIVWIGLKVAIKAPDEDHPYGHGKAEPLAAVVVSFFLIGAAIVIAMESVENISIPHTAPEAYTLLVPGAVIFIKEYMYRRVNKTGTDINSTAVKADAWHHRSDAITSFAAFVGISIALIGGPGYESADDYAAMISSAVIAYNGYKIFRPAFQEIMDAAPPKEILETVRNSAIQVKGVEALDKGHVRKMGFEYFVDLHVQVNGNLSVEEGHTIAHKVKAAIMENDSRIFDVLIHIEPFRKVLN